jgi:ketosteroid isomerase-like protein
METAHATVGELFARHLLAKDWERLATVLAPDVDFRGLTPGRHWEAADAREAIDGVFKSWFEPGDDVYEVVDVATDRVVDRERVVYRARIRNSEGDFVCEQTAYYDTANGRITKLRILCSGFQPTAGRLAQAV